MALHFRIKKMNDSEGNLNSRAGDVKRRHQVANCGTAGSSVEAAGRSGGDLLSS